MTDLNYLEGHNCEEQEQGFVCRLFGLFYEDLLGGMLNNFGYEVKGPYRGGRGCAEYFDFVLKKDNEYFLAEAKCQPRALGKKWYEFDKNCAEKIEQELRSKERSNLAGISKKFFSDEAENTARRKLNIGDEVNFKRMIIWWKKQIDPANAKIKVNNKEYSVEIKSIYEMLQQTHNRRELFTKYKEWSGKLFDLLEETLR